MLKEDKVTVLIATLIAIIVATIFSYCAFVSYNDNVTMAEMVANGVDPIDALCAVKHGSEVRETCLVRTVTLR